jgi:threonine aldolase
MLDVDEIYLRCDNKLPGHGSRRSLKTVLQTLADGLDGSEMDDDYGQGEYLNSFEAEMAALFGKEAGVFMPSGTMAQQIALRVWCERRKDFTVAMHPTAHLEFAEFLGYQFLHGIQRIQFGAPEFLANRILTVDDLQALPKEPGALLLELPYRPLGGELPTWEDLSAMSAWARQRGIPFHMDGARLWACRPHFQKSYREIADLFDSVYISFYKDLGGIAGSMLLGPASFIKEARMWQRRHGGNLPGMGPLVAAAVQGYRRVEPQIDGWVRRAQEVAAVLAQHERVTIRPYPPQANFFQFYLRGDPTELTERHHILATETGTFLFFGLGQSIVPGVAVTEVHCWENAQKFDLARLPEFLKRLLG